MAGIFKTFSPKLNPMHLMGVSGDSMAGMPSDAIGYVAEGGLSGQYSPEKFPLTPELEAKGLTKEKWEEICKSLSSGKGMLGMDGGFSKAIAKANEDFLDGIGCIGEMDKNGKVLTGYQNKECKSFYLPLDNGGYGFEWVSNLQVICVVHLKPTQGKNRTFTLPAADKKTVTEAMKKMQL